MVKERRILKGREEPEAGCEAVENCKGSVKNRYKDSLKKIRSKYLFLEKSLSLIFHS